MKEGRGDELVLPVLKELQDYVIYHFQSEETWMKMCDYPYIDKYILETGRKYIPFLKETI
jgi:hemerythrin